jgi:hypothetical protein
MARWAKIMAIIAAIEGVITFAGVVLVALTLRATRRAVHAAEKTIQAMVRIERPYIQAQNFRLGAFPKASEARRAGLGDQLVSVYGEARNCGSRLALITGVGIGHMSSRLPLPPLVPRSQATFAPHTVAPDAKHTWDIPLCAITVPEATARTVLTGGVWFFYGFFRYVDAQKVTRRSGFAFEFWDAGEDRLTLSPSGPAEYWYDIEEQPETDSDKTRSHWLARPWKRRSVDAA